MWCDTLTLHHRARARSGRSNRTSDEANVEKQSYKYDYNKLTTMITR